MAAAGDFREGNLLFRFAPGWRVLPYDKLRVTEAVRNVEARRAVDFVGIAPNGNLWLIEVKDFRGHVIENKHKLGGPLEQLVAHKVHDSLAGMVVAARHDPDPLFWRDALTLAMKADQRVNVVLWLEDDRLWQDPARGATTVNNILDLLKKRVKNWSGFRCMVSSLSEPATGAGLEVQSLPGAGQPN